MRLVKIKIIIGNINTKIRYLSLKIFICYINELVQKLLDNTSIFHYDAQLGVCLRLISKLKTKVQFESQVESF